MNLPLDSATVTPNACLCLPDFLSPITLKWSPRSPYYTSQVLSTERETLVDNS